MEESKPDGFSGLLGREEKTLGTAYPRKGGSTIRRWNDYRQGSLQHLHLLMRKGRLRSWESKFKSLENHQLAEELAASSKTQTQVQHF